MTVLENNLNSKLNDKLVNICHSWRGYSICLNYGVVGRTFESTFVAGLQSEWTLNGKFSLWLKRCIMSIVFCLPTELPFLVLDENPLEVHCPPKFLTRGSESRVKQQFDLTNGSFKTSCQRMKEVSLDHHLCVDSKTKSWIPKGV